MQDEPEDAVEHLRKLMDAIEAGKQKSAAVRSWFPASEGNLFPVPDGTEYESLTAMLRRISEGAAELRTRQGREVSVQAIAESDVVVKLLLQVVRIMEEVYREPGQLFTGQAGLECIKIGIMLGELSTIARSRHAEHCYTSGLKLRNSADMGAEATRLTPPTRQQLGDFLEAKRALGEKELVVDRLASEAFGAGVTKIREWKSNYGLLKRPKKKN